MHILIGCIVIIVFASVMRYMLGNDPFNGEWIGEGIISGKEMSKFPDSHVYTLKINNGKAEYRINGEEIPTSYRKNRLRVDVSAGVGSEYELSMYDNKLHVQGKNGEAIVFRKVMEEVA